jgi:hypothetical protein
MTVTRMNRILTRKTMDVEKAAVVCGVGALRAFCHLLVVAMLGASSICLGQVVPSTSDQAPAGAESAVKRILVLLGSTRYAIPNDYFDGPLDEPGERQGAVLLKAWLPNLTPESVDSWQSLRDSRESQNRRIAILAQAPAVKDGKIQDRLRIRYRTYVGDITAYDETERRHRFEAAPIGLRRVVDVDESSEQWKMNPDVYIEGDEEHPTTIVHCGRAGVGGVNFPGCSVDFMSGQTYVAVDIRRDHLNDWRTIRDAVRSLMDGFHTNAGGQR